jgi:hypothetical protein
MALRIEKAFGVPMDTLLRMHAWHDSHAMRQRAGEIDFKRYEPRLTFGCVHSRRGAGRPLPWVDIDSLSRYPCNIPANFELSS